MTESDRKRREDRLCLALSVVIALNWCGIIAYAVWVFTR